MSAADTSFLLHVAVDLHQRGDAVAAHERYLEVLRRQPRNVDARYLLGLLCCQQGNIADGAKHLRKAVSLAPAHAAAHNTLGMALHRLGRLDEARASLERAIACDPRCAEAHASYADVLREVARPQEALAAYDRALALNPEIAATWCNRGILLQELDRHEDAVTSYDRATALAPDFAEAWLNRGRALRGLARLDDALASCDRAIAARPNFAEAHLGRGLLLKDLGRFEEAVTSFDRVVALKPTWAEAHLERADSLRGLGDYPAALAGCDQAIALNAQLIAPWLLRSRLFEQRGAFDDASASVERALLLEPQSAQVHARRGAILFKQNRPADALAAFDRALAIAPDLSTARTDRGQCLQALGRFDEAFADLECGLGGSGQDPHVQFVVGLAELLHGRWIEGFSKFERRIEVPMFNQLHRRFLDADNDADRRFSLRPEPEALALPRWNGEPPTGDVLLLETEQGLGDAIQFSGFAAELATQGYRVKLLTLPILAPLLGSIPGIEDVISDRQSLNGLGPLRWLPLMSVPFVRKITPETVPFAPPYLGADPARVATWRERLGAGGFKIGLAWQGNPANWLDAGRSIPLEAFRPLTDIPGVRLISLQKQPGAEQIATVDFGGQLEQPTDADDKSADALLETAAMIANLDLVVTSCSMLAHLAGALGRPTFIALRRIPDWRWLLDRDDSPWYPTARLFRQQTEGDWQGVLQRIGIAVRELVASGRGR